MLMKDAIKGYLLDSKIARHTSKHIGEQERQLHRLRVWCEGKGVMQVEEVTALLVKEYIVHLQELIIGESEQRVSYRGRRLSPHTIANSHRILRAFFMWCERESYLSGTNPMRKVPRVKIPTFVIATLSAGQMQRLLDTCDLTAPLGFRDYTILLVFMDTGIRVSELCGLHVDDVHDDYLKVFGKFSKEREVGLGVTASRALFKYIHHFRKPHADSEQHVFLGKTGRPLTPSMVWRMLHGKGEEVGIEDIRVSPHTLRHSFSVAWLENKGDVVSLSRTLGHTRLETTQIYLKDFQSREARVHHDEYSPVEVHRLGRQTRKNRRRNGA